MSVAPRTPFLSLGALTAGLAMGLSVLAPATPAQAHPNTWTKVDKRATSNCPCTLNDEWDGTYFLRDSGGLAGKMRIYSGQRLAGKVEFHPYDEKFYLYDTLANRNALYFQIVVDGRSKFVKAPGGGKPKVLNQSFREGATVQVIAWDNHKDGRYSKRLGSMVLRA